MPDAQTSPAPTWFRDAVVDTPTPGRLQVEGCEIATLTWGSADRPAIVLVHGGAAHAWWWAFLAPLLARDHHVVALDLSGHGDSGRRGDYTFAGWAQEVAAVVEGVGASETVVIGHSMGGVVAAIAGPLLPGLGGVIMVDAPLGPPDREVIGDSEAVFQRVRRSSDRAGLVRRFRPLPPQPVEHPALLEFVGDRSVVRDGRGWAWKFDPRAFAVPLEDRPADCSDDLEAARCPVGAIVGERSHVVPETDRRRLRELARLRGGDLVVVPGGHHHLMFDQPRTLIGAIAGLAARLREAGGRR